VACFTAGDDHPRGRARGGLSDSGMASWICGAFFLNGLISNAFSLRANLLCAAVFVERDCRVRRAPGDHAARGPEQRKI